MTEPPSHVVTQLLDAARLGAAGAQDRLWKFLYDELHRLAGAQLAREASNHDLQPTVLVNEAYLRLMAGGGEFENRRHFFKAATEAMRRILVDAARARRRVKRGGGQRPATLENEPPVFGKDPAEILGVDDALVRLARLEPRQAEVVKQRYFGGLNVEETAQILGVSPRTIEIDWKLAKAWLHRELSDNRD